MTNAPVAIDRRLRASGVLLISGLAVELASLVWEKPLAFLLFAFVGCTLILAGTAVYLYFLVSRR